MPLPPLPLLLLLLLLLLLFGLRWPTTKTVITAPPWSSGALLPRSAQLSQVASRRAAALSLGPGAVMMPTTTNSRCSGSSVGTAGGESSEAVHDARSGRSRNRVEEEDE